MAVGTVSTSILTDIANAIRYQAGVATTYLPREMAAAVAALDGANAGNYQAQPYKSLQSGILSERVFSDIANAIRAQNGSNEQYQPVDMAAAILALSWDSGLKIRALLLTDGTLEFSYRDGGASPLGTVTERFTVDAAGYSSASARPWDSVKALVTRVVFDSSFANAGMTNLAYFCTAFSNMTDVVGFQHCSGAVNVTQMFNSCAKLETIYATSFDNSTITSYSAFLYGCNRLVGGTDGFVPTSTSGKTVLKLGSGGVLTDPDADARTWFHAFMYSDGCGVLSASSVPDANKTLVAANRICAIGKYQALGFTPWDSTTGATHRNNLVRVVFDADMRTFTYLNLNYLLYSCTAVSSVSGLGNLSGVRSMRYTFASCQTLGELDFRGFEPSTLTDLFYCFSGCSVLKTIYADSSWTLPTSGLSGSQCFYNCSELVGGNGTTYASSRTSYSYFRIDTGSTPGYLTAAS